MTRTLVRPQGPLREGATMRTVRQPQHGQIVVVFAIALIAMIAMVGLVIDGGNAFANQRGTQNAADASSEAGATVLAQSINLVINGDPPKADADVLAAINLAADDNSIRPFGLNDATESAAYYTDIFGNMLRADGTTTTSLADAARVGAGTIPPCNDTAACVNGSASGVRALGRRDFQPVIAAAVGFSTFSVQSDATAVAGYAGDVCDASEGCALLPITFATNPATCDGSGDEQWVDPVTGLPYGPWAPLPPGTALTSANEIILTICKKDNEGAFGWVDYGCGNTATQIESPCNTQIYFPTWWVGQPGNVNAVEDELAAYFGDVVGTYEPGEDIPVLIPFFDGLCDEDRPGAEPPNPPDDEDPVFTAPNPIGECLNNPPGGGANRHFHFLFFAGFVLDRAYVQGNNQPECNVAPGAPLPGGNGSSGCFKGWFTFVATQNPVNVTPQPGNPATPLTVQLIR